MKHSIPLYITKDPKIATGLFIYFVSFVLEGMSFNLESGEAFIIEGEQSGSEFGVSVALWQDKRLQKCVVVGAPKWKQKILNFSNGEEIWNAEDPLGAIITYDMNGKMSIINTVPVLKKKEEWKALKLAFESKFISIGLGETIRTSNSSSSLLACAPRQLGLIENENEKSLSLRGTCYLMEDTKSPPKVLSPYADNFVIWGGNKTLETPSANAGMGAYLSKNGTVVMGVPTMFYDTGAICSFNPESKHEFLSCTRSSSNSFGNSFYEGWAVVEGLFDGSNQYYAVSIPGQPAMIGKVIFYTKGFRRVPKFNLLGEEFGGRFGYNLESGDFNGDLVSDLVVSSHLSQVKTFGSNNEEFVLTDAGKVFIYYSPLLKIGKEQEVTVLKGLKSRSYFGFSIFCPGDLNDDGYQDLLVGAPYDGLGKVYVFSGSIEGLIPYPSQIITHIELLKPGLRTQRGIGFSLGGGLDIDSNGYPDIVIGAPLSSSAIVVRSSPVIKFKIDAQFGDGSGVISLGKRKCLITLPDESVANLTCFNMTVSVQYVSQMFRERLEVSIGIDLDTRKSSSRILFHSNERSFDMTREVSNALNSPEPFNVLVYVKPVKPSLTEPITTKLRTNLVSKSRMAKLLKIEEGDVSLNSFILPVVDAFSRNEEEIRVRIQCDDDTTCYTKSDLFLDVRGIKNFTVGLKTLLQVNISLIAKSDPAFQVKLEVSIPSVFQFFRLLRNVISVADHDGDIWCTSTITDMKLIDKGSSLSCFVSDYLPVDREVEFSLLFSHFPLKAMTSLKEPSSSNFEFQFDVSSDTTDRKDEDNHATWSPKPTLNNKIYLSGFSIPEVVNVWTNNSEAREKALEVLLHQTDYYPKLSGAGNKKISLPECLGAEIKHHYVIVNAGYSPIIDAKVTIRWPSTIDKIPLIILKEISTSGSVECNEIQIHSLLRHNQMSKAKTEDSYEFTEKLANGKRILKPEEKEEELKDFKNASFLLNASYNSSSSSTIQLDCDKLHCETISCKIELLLSKEEISIEITSIAVAAFLKMFNQRHFIFSSKLSFESEFISLKNESRISTAITIGKPVLNKSELLLQHWWIFLVSVIVGILILALISAILYKVGFFKRKRMHKAKLIPKEDPVEPLVSSENVQVEMVDTTPPVKQFINPINVEEEAET